MLSREKQSGWPDVFVSDQNGGFEFHILIAMYRDSPYYWCQGGLLRVKSVYVTVMRRVYGRIMLGAFVTGTLLRHSGCVFYGIGDLTFPLCTFFDYPESV